ncbi:hypothetical protein PIB30_043705 [Stylosanthes scabra]|uniref:Uncharacterized protein n=1 Tax=Stylosanthes scabra TaxID=79078 RepID=A0ABU6TFC6_9FABA|nr:hypothetical protein [Stylosanthes scabra]
MSVVQKQPQCRRGVVRGGVAPIPLGMGEALMVGGCRPSNAPVATALNQCMSVLGGRGGIGGSTSAAGGDHGIGPLAGDAGCPRGTGGGGGGAVGEPNGIGASFWL